MSATPHGPPSAPITPDAAVLNDAAATLAAASDAVKGRYACVIVLAFAAATTVESPSATKC